MPGESGPLKLFWRLKRTTADKKEAFAQSVVFLGKPQKHIRLLTKECFTKSRQTHVFIDDKFHTAIKKD